MCFLLKNGLKTTKKYEVMTRQSWVIPLAYPFTNRLKPTQYIPCLILHPFPFLLAIQRSLPHQKNRKNKWVSASLFQEGASPLDGASGGNFREILKQDAVANPLTTLLPSSSMLISTIPSLQTVTKHMKLFTPLLKLWFLCFSIFLWICDDLGETEAGVIGFWDAEILEGGDAGIQCGHGFLEIEATVAVLIGFFKWETGRLHGSCNRIAGFIESYNQYHNQWS